MSRREQSLPLPAFDEELLHVDDGLAAVLDAVCRRAARLVGEASVVALVSPDGERLEPVAAHHDDGAVLASIRAALGTIPYALGEGIAGRVAADGHAVRVAGIDPEVVTSAVHGSGTDFATRHPLLGLMIVPLWSAGEVIGTLGVVRLEDPTPYDDQDQAVLEALAERAARAVADLRRPPVALPTEDLQAMWRHVPDGVVLLDGEGTVVAANPAACDVLRMTEEQLCGLRQDDLLDLDDLATVAALADRELTGRSRAELRGRRGDGEPFTADVTAATYTTPDGQVRTCAIFRDISDEVGRREQLARQAALLEHQSESDVLTGMRNRRGFLRAAAQELAGAARDGRGAQLLFLDLDELKAVNDDCGHAADDELLRRCATAILAVTRRADVCGRLGGDEFAVLLHGADRAEADDVLGRIIEATTGSDGRPVSVSAGVASYDPAAAPSLEDLLAESDRRMYEAKFRRRFGDEAPGGGAPAAPPPADGAP